MATLHNITLILHSKICSLSEIAFSFKCYLGTFNEGGLRYDLPELLAALKNIDESRSRGGKTV